MPRPHGLTQGSGCLAQKQLIHLLVTGVRKIIGGVHLYIRFPESCKNTKAKGTLIIPEWPSAPYWPLLFPNGWDPANCVLELLELPSSEELFLPGRLGSNLFGGLPNTPVLALRLEF